MTSKDYFFYALQRELLYRIEWFYSVMTLPTSNTTENNYLKIKDGYYYVKLDEDFEKIDDVSISQPLLRMVDKVVLPAGVLENAPKEIATTIGRVIMNKLLLSDIFKDAIPYLNEKFMVKTLETMIAKLILSEKVSIPSYIKFVDTASYIQGLSRITTVSSTKKGMLPPPGIDAFKKKVEKELIDKYGPLWASDRSNVALFEARLKEFDSEWLKDDPANGKLLAGKIKNESRSKLFLTFGAEAGFDKKGDNVQLVENSLLDGYPKDNALLTTMFNTSRSGSFERGKETQKGGSTAKDILRATSAIKIVPGDCGSKLGKSILVSNENKDNLVGRYRFKSDGKGKDISCIETTDDLIGKNITLRSPLYCAEKGNNFCATCVGDIMASYPTGISLVLLDISASFITTSLKGMHKSSLKSTKIEITDMIS